MFLVSHAKNHELWNSESQFYKYHPMAFVDKSCYLLSSFPLMGICALHCLRCFGFGSATLLVSPVPFMVFLCTAVSRMFVGRHTAPYLCSGLARHTPIGSIFPDNATRGKESSNNICSRHERSCFPHFTTFGTYRRVLPVLCRQPCPLLSFRPNAWLPSQQ